VTTPTPPGLVETPTAREAPADGDVPPPRSPSAATAMAVAALGGISRRMLRHRIMNEPWAVDAGLRPPCLGVLAVIDQQEPVSQRQISDRLRLDPSDVVSVVDLLERVGFVSRGRSTDDRRRYALTLTTAGRRALRRLEALAEEAQHELLAPLDEADRATFERLVRQVVAHHAARAVED